MFPPEGAAEDVPLVQRIARWSEWWCAPRWRALLTWVGLAGLSATVQHQLGINRMNDLCYQVYQLVYRFTHLYPPPAVQIVYFSFNFMILWVWFEPLVLRLNLARGALWLAIRVVPYCALGLFPPVENIFLVGAILWFLPMVAVMPVLVGWRSPAWMTMIGGALTFGLYEISHEIPFTLIPFGLWQLFSVAYAPVLIYGTRLLRPEERASRESGRDRPPASGL